MTDEHKKEIDQVSGVETTGHEWDGIKELNNPAPRWWLWVFYVCVIWSIGYYVVYPAWPTLSGATKGMFGYTQYKELAESQKEIISRQEAYLGKFTDASLADIIKDPELYAFAQAGGAAAFKDNCATCHGTGGAGGKGFPNLNDDDWLWGGTVEDIYQTLQYGIRSGHEEARVSQMPAFGKDALLQPDEINAVVDYVLTLSGGEQKATYTQGQEIFAANCASCHGEAGEGMRDFGAPKLSDAIWLYGGDRATVYETVFYARAGVMPAWKDRLDDNTIRQLAVYVHELGGGEASAAAPASAETVAPASPETPAVLEENIPADVGSTAPAAEIQPTEANTDTSENAGQ